MKCFLFLLFYSFTYISNVDPCSYTSGIELTLDDFRDVGIHRYTM